ncbi:MAG: hypothetical protein K0S23_73 [Fluviicola sp.]|jgi:hypothetical protein|uniref:hypothetical protein n=1 Tax=Fluviicola sp. TaxID=1917219 RepID=UPI002618452B|nr:hypothetical protein [Fluviicola sp.]MDF3025766.1 hypothetical protein [Fluviicola sp.]
MKQLLFFFSICLITAACSDNPEKEDSGKPKPETEVAAGEKEEKSIDTVPKRNPVVRALNPAQLKKLNALLPKKTVESIISYMDELATVQTDTAFARVYHKGKKVFEDIEKAVSIKFPDGYNGMEAMNFINSSFALRSSCEAECTEFVMNYNYTDLQKLAQYTKGKADDDFMSLKILAEGDQGRHEPGWLNFFERTWDYGGGSLLGDSNNYKFLAGSFNVINKSDLFKKDLLTLRKRVIQDMEHRIYMFPKPVVLAEINRILKTKILSYPEAHQILLLKQSIERDQEDPALQFNCSDPEQNCDWGG